MNQIALKTSSTIAATALFALGSFIPSTTSQNHPPLLTKIHLSEITDTPKIREINNSNWSQEALSLLPGISGFTKEEVQTYNEVIDELFVATGRNLFEL